MAAVETFDLRQFGKADWATVGSWFHLFPQEFRNKLNRSETEVLKWSVFYLWHAMHRNGRATPYVSFSQAKVGEKFGRSRWTVFRALAKLEWMGLIRQINRRPRPGQQWQTNLTILTPKLLQMMKACLQKKRPKNPCSTSAPQVFPNTTKTESAPSSEGRALSQKEKFPVGEAAKAALARFFPNLVGRLSM